MGAAKAALIGACGLLWLGLPSQAAAGCLGQSPRGPFPTCFDIGNRAWLAGGVEGVSAGIDLRHRILFEDEPDLVWKLSHGLARVAAAGPNGSYRAQVYSGRFVRHARDGHLVVPLGRPHKIFLPFDIGAQVDFAELAGTIGETEAEMGFLRVVPLVELARSATFTRRLSLGPVARWDSSVELAEHSLLEQRVSPFSMLAASAYAESANGLSVAELEVEAGKEWTSGDGWRWELRAMARIERAVLALNDRPLSIYVGSRYRRSTAALSAELGLRFAFVQRRDPRATARR